MRASERNMKEEIHKIRNKRCEICNTMPCLLEVLMVMVVVNGSDDSEAEAATRESHETLKSSLSGGCNVNRGRVGYVAACKHLKLLDKIGFTLAVPAFPK